MNTNGNLHQKKLLGLSLNGNLALLLEYLLIIMAGSLAAYMHFRLKIPLNIPGHHGLEFMAIFTLVRMSSGIRYAATLATLGVGFMFLMPGMGASTPLHSFGYILPGIALDMFYLVHKGRNNWLIFIALSAGVAYMFIPLSRLFMQAFSSYPYMAFIKFGVVYTLLSFFFFGMMGGVLGYSLNSIKSLSNKNQ